MVGADADLPCHLSPNISVEDMEMRWYRDQPSQAVHVHKKGKDMQEEQMVRYRGRTSLVRAGLAQGQATVRIYNISALDNGTFHCHFKDGTTFQEATLQLRVAGEAGPHISPRASPPRFCPHSRLSTCGPKCLTLRTPTACASRHIHSQVLLQGQISQEMCGFVF